MRRGALLIGSVLALAIAGCGGSGGSTAPPAPAPPTAAGLRAALRHTIDAKLEKLGRPAKEIACVNGNIDAMSAPQIAEQIVESAPVTEGVKPSAAEVLGPLGRGCP
jgi:hypothetical protein